MARRKRKGIDEPLRELGEKLGVISTTTTVAKPAPMPRISSAGMSALTRNKNRQRAAYNRRRQNKR